MDLLRQMQGLVSMLENIPEPFLGPSVREHLNFLSGISRDLEPGIVRRNRRRRARLEWLRSRLDRAETGILEALMQGGGFMGIEDFSRRFEYDENEDVFAPVTAAARLKCLGLVNEGVIRGKESVFVPGSLFPTVSRILEPGPARQKKVGPDAPTGPIFRRDEGIMCSY